MSCKTPILPCVSWYTSESVNDTVWVNFCFIQNSVPEFQNIKQLLLPGVLFDTDEHSYDWTTCFQFTFVLGVKSCKFLVGCWTQMWCSLWSVLLAVGGWVQTFAARIMIISFNTGAYALTLILLMWSIGWAPNNASKWQMGFNSVFKGLITKVIILKSCTSTCIDNNVI